MTECLQYVFCCLFLQKNQTRRRPQQPTSGNIKKKKQQKLKIKPSRIISKYKSQEIIEMNKQQQKNNKHVYTCPICTLYFNKILACDQCENNMCRNCVLSYEKKFQSSTLNMKCPFCNSEDSRYIDYDQQAKSYFDTTGKNGFLDPIERKKIDEEMKWNESKKLSNVENPGSRQLQRIEEESALENAIPTMNQIEPESQLAESRIRNEQNIEENSRVHLGNNNNGSNNQRSALFRLNA